MEMHIEALSAEPGQKSTGYIYVEVGISSLRLPLILINGAKPGPRITLIAGVHHGEFVGIEALVQWLKAVDPSDLRGQIIACPVVNPPAVYGHAGSNSPLDGINLNRIFPGRERGRPSERLAYWLFRELVADSDVFVDLHSGGLSENLLPFVGIRSSGDEELDRRTREAAEAFGIEHIVWGKSPGGGNSHAAATRAGIVGLLVEVGENGSRHPEQIAQVKNGLFRLLKHLEMLDAEVPMPDVATKDWVWADEASASVDGLWYPSFEIGEDVEEGAELGQIRDPLGQLLAVVKSPCSGRVFYGVRGLAFSAGDDIAAIAQLEG